MGGCRGWCLIDNAGGDSYSVSLSSMSEPFVVAIGQGFQFLFQKELRASDVSSLGRIILPKVDA